MMFELLLDVMERFLNLREMRIKTVQTARASLATPGADSCSPPQEVFNGLIKCVWSFQVRNVPNVR